MSGETLSRLGTLGLEVVCAIIEITMHRRTGCGMTVQVEGSKMTLLQVTHPSVY